jgi:hypothetical protein
MIRQDGMSACDCGLDPNRLTCCLVRIGVFLHLWSRIVGSCLACAHAASHSLAVKDIGERKRIDRMESQNVSDGWRWAALLAGLDRSCDFDGLLAWHEGSICLIAALDQRIVTHPLLAPAHWDALRQGVNIGMQCIVRPQAGQAMPFIPITGYRAVNSGI